MKVKLVVWRGGRSRCNKTNFKQTAGSTLTVFASADAADKISLCSLAPDLFTVMVRLNQIRVGLFFSPVS